MHDVCTILGALLLQVADLGDAVLAYRIILEPWWMHSRRVPVHCCQSPPIAGLCLRVSPSPKDLLDYMRVTSTSHGVTVAPMLAGTWMLPSGTRDPCTDCTLVGALTKLRVEVSEELHSLIAAGLLQW